MGVLPVFPHRVMGPRTKTITRNGQYQRNRLARLRSAMAESHLDWLIVSSLPNVHYLSGFSGSAGALVIGEDRAEFFSDSRYDIQSHREVKTFRVRIVKGAALFGAARWLAGRKSGRIGFESATTPVAVHKKLKETLSGNKLIATGGLVETLRMVKDPGELRLIRDAVHLGSRAFEETVPLLRPGISETEVAAEIEYRMRLLGGERPSFETIVAFGPRTALPHARPGTRKLTPKQFVLMDLGVILSGYASDMTRTLYWGKAPLKAKRIYQAVLDAQLEAESVVRAGLACGEVDRAARRVLDKSGFGRYFTHSTGHGVGREVHEMPGIYRQNRDPLQEGAVITVEPGVYLPGYGGVRIEDMVVVGKTSGEVLTTTAKELIEL